MARLGREHLGDMSDEGARVKARRERLGMHVTDLAREAGVNRNTLSALEAGSSFNRTTLTKVERVLDEAEAEAGIDAPVPAELHGAAEPQIVTIKLSSGMGVDIVVSGPVGSIDELRKTAEALLRASASGDEK